LKVALISGLHCGQDLIFGGLNSENFNVHWPQATDSTVFNLRKLIQYMQDTWMLYLPR